MDLQRLLLAAALILVSVMLLVEWTAFRKEQLTPPSVESRVDTAPVTEAPITPSATTADLPVVAPPAEEVPLESENKPTSSSPVAGATAPMITVRTDKLLVEISLHGGDFSSVSLPEHLAEVGVPDRPFRLLQQTPDHSYTAQSGLIGPNGTDTAASRPVFRAAQSAFDLADGENQLAVDLVLDEANGVSILKRFIFHRGEYTVDVEYRVDNRGGGPWQAALFGQLRRDDRPDPSAETAGALGIQPFIGFATRTAQEPYLKHDFESVAEEPYNGETTGGWIALVQHYFISAWIPAPQSQNRYALLRSETGFNIGRFTSPSVTIAPGSSGLLAATFYAGPKDQYRLIEISPGLELTVDYGWLWWVAQPLFALLHFFATGELHAFGWVSGLGDGVGNWGIAIILLTLLVKAAFFQLSATSYKSMAKMRKLQPKMLELRERYGEDRQKLSQETMELYRREKVNPLGGCLPILIQMPVFLALYWVLLESVELRHAPFFGWIKDLSVMDPYFVLPLLMGASMYYQQTLNPPPPDPVQAKVFQFMPVIFTVFFLFFPAGLVLYWLVNNVLSIAQQWVITRQIERGS
jgi:YidC/Oxa1 family membrane protein insertase